MAKKPGCNEAKSHAKKLLSQLHSEKVIQKVILDFYSKVLPFGCMLWYR